MKDIIKRINETLIRNYETQIKACEAAIEFLHSRENEILKDSTLIKPAKRKLILGIQDKITYLNNEIQLHMSSIRELNWEMKQ